MQIESGKAFLAPIQSNVS